MENASQALIIAGAVLVAILIIAISVYVYNNSRTAASTSLSAMTTQEIEAFNNQFESYKGKQTGSKVMSLLGKLIANASVYKDQIEKIPDVYNGKDHESINLNTDLENYTKKLSEFKNEVEKKHMYNVVFSYNTDGLLEKIFIWYDKDNTSTEEVSIIE